MKKQIKRLSPHQNGKVAGIMMAVTTLPMILFMIIPMTLMTPKIDQAGNPVDFGFPFIMLLIMPIFYLIFTYLFVAFGCWVYNIFYKIIGGFEFEFDENQ